MYDEAYRAHDARRAQYLHAEVVIHVAVHVPHGVLGRNAAVREAHAEHGRGQEIGYAVRPASETAVVRLVEAQEIEHARREVGDVLPAVREQHHAARDERAAHDDQRDVAVVYPVGTAHAADDEARYQHDRAHDERGARAQEYDRGVHHQRGEVCPRAFLGGVRHVHGGGYERYQHPRDHVRHAPAQHHVGLVEVDERARVVEYEQFAREVQFEREREHLRGYHQPEYHAHLADVRQHAFRLVAHAQRDEVYDDDAHRFKQAVSKVDGLPLGRERAVEQEPHGEREQTEREHAARGERTAERAAAHQPPDERDRDDRAAHDDLHQSRRLEKRRNVLRGGLRTQHAVPAYREIGHEERHGEHFHVVVEKRGEYRENNVDIKYGQVRGHTESTCEHAQRRIYDREPHGLLPSYQSADKSVRFPQ